jgi:hypothetical protein
MVTEYNDKEKSCFSCHYDGIDADCSATQVCSNYKPTDKWTKALEPHDKCRPILTKKVKLFPGLVLWCNRGKNMLLIEKNGMSGYVDLANAQNPEAVVAWIKDVEETTTTYK